uniref:THAP-type domain-containing protein n=1 Tax=Sinocyclocheilus grahami TaxID=75366 RepID=A0A672QLK9_SINGR
MVGNSCCIKNCNSKSHSRSRKKRNNRISFFHFPTCKHREGKHVEEVKRRHSMAWIAATRQKDISYSNISKSMKVCSLHFQSGESHGLLFVLKFPQKPVDDRVQSEAVEKAQEDEEVQLKEKMEVRQQDMEETERTRQDDDPVQNPHDHGVQECELCQSRHDEINRLLNENRQLNYAIFQVLLCHIMPFLPPGKKKVTPFQMVLLTFMRLRLDLPIQHKAHLFSVHRDTVSAAFKETVSVLYSRFMPHQFVEAFGNRVAAIVDCFDVFIEQPSNLQARAQTFSSYKHSHTLKYLISITPQGVISFISKGWGGCTSDKRITENCGFLDKLLPGDLVLADRGFDIKESVGLMCAEVKVPAFTKGQQQLEAKDVEETRHIAHLQDTSCFFFRLTVPFHNCEITFGLKICDRLHRILELFAIFWQHTQYSRFAISFMKICIELC